MIERLKKLCCSAIDFNVPAAVNLARDTFPSFRDGFSRLERRGYVRANRYFEGIDAETYYCMVRHFRPDRIIEIGSGFSTIVARLAVDDGRLSTKILAIDPSPRVEIREVADEWIGEAVEAVDPKALLSLKSGDILFVDCSHRVRAGGDVVFLLTEIVPRMSPGVIIHFHDIFLPFDYPQPFAAVGLSEQYMLHAFLSWNRAFEVLWAGCLMRHDYERLLEEVFGLHLGDILPGSFWMKKLT